MRQLIPLAIYAVAEVALLVWIWRVPHRAIWVLLVLLPVHTLGMVLIFNFVQPTKTYLSAYQVWKDVVILIALIRVAFFPPFWRQQRAHALDLAVLAVTAVALLSIPLHRSLGLSSQVLALRNELILVPLYALGRLTPTTASVRLQTIVLLAVVGVAVAAIGVVERLFDPLKLLADLSLPGYWAANFHVRFLSYLGLPYSYFAGNGARRIGSVFLTPVGLASAGGAAIAAGSALIWADNRHVRTGIAAIAAGVAAPILAVGRTELAITPVLLALAALLTRQFRVMLAAGGYLAALFVLFSFTYYVQPYQQEGQPTTARDNGNLATLVSPDNPSAASHLASLKTAGLAMIHKPLGEGLGTSGLSGVRNGSGSGEGELVVVVESLGDIELILLAVLLAGGAYVCYRGIREGPDKQLALTGGLLLVAVALTFPIAEILSDLFMMAATFWILGQVVRLRSSDASTA